MNPEVVVLDHHLAEIADHALDLFHAAIPGTPPPWTEPTLTPEARAEADARARLERIERSELGMGESPAPCRVDVLDVILEVTVYADAVACQCATAVGLPTPPPAASAYADPRPHLAFIRAHLADAWNAEPDWAASWARQAASLAKEVARVLRLVRDGQVLKAECPWCHGAGQRNRWTMRIRDTRDGPVVVCTNPGCDPPEQDCGRRLGGQPAWPVHEWEWLATRMEHAS